MTILRWAHDLLEFCYPGICGSCDSPCEDGSRPLCDACYEALGQLEAAPGCPSCAAPVAQAGAPCQFCNGGGIPHYDRVARLGLFDGPIKELIRKVDMVDIGKAMSGWLAAPPPDLRAALTKWAEEREIEVE